MIGLFASLLVLCPAQGLSNAARGKAFRECSKPRELELSVAARPVARELRELTGSLTSSVESVLRGLTLFESRPDSSATGSTVQLRPGFGSKGPLAMFHLSF